MLATGGRLLIVAPRARRSAGNSTGCLWTYSADSFLPHAEARGDDGDRAQPVLIAADVDAANGARHIALADGRWRDDALDFDRAFHFCSTRAASSEARAAWKALGGPRADVERRYWKQNEAGRWEQAA